MARIPESYEGFVDIMRSTLHQMKLKIQMIEELLSETGELAEDIRDDFYALQRSFPESDILNFRVLMKNIETGNAVIEFTHFRKLIRNIENGIATFNTREIDAADHELVVLQNLLHKEKNDEEER